MCGLIGFGAIRRLADSSDWLYAGRDSMAHRGPDDAGAWFSSDGRVGLGHRRLSILDVSPLGHQPMRDESRGLSIVFNGEIYNFEELRSELAALGYEFRSRSDTEVLLAAYAFWGTDCVARLNGMFVFAIHDARRQRLLIARDRAGEKPLFYSLTDNVLRFASELKGLMASSMMERRIDPVALDCYLAFGFVPGSLCMLKGVNKLPPAHALTFDLEGAQLRVWRYWHLPDPPREPRSSERADDSFVDALETLFEDAVRRQLVADVPVGVLLSGGVDSSLVTAMAARARSKVKTFTIRFPGHGTYDETDHARLVAKHFGTEHLELEAHETTVDLLPQLAHQFDEPVVDSSMVPTYLVSQLVRQHCTVALGGDGGDELFGGYSHYSRLRWVEEKLGGTPRFLRSFVSAAATQALPIGMRGRNYLQALDCDLERGLPQIDRLFDADARSRLAAHRVPSGAAESVWEQRVPNVDQVLQRATRMDFENYLPEDLLVKVDRASMLNSLELRAPLLDYRIVEFAFGQVPARLRATTTERKVLLKMLAERVLPRRFDRHRKQGFSLPLHAWLRSGSWLNFFRDVLLGESESMFDRKLVAGLFSGQESGRTNSERLFALVMFELWRRDYSVSI
jgi:asparagine synthase (glutamine-hydrolysing)